jgi:hypothetical protein
MARHEQAPGARSAEDHCGASAAVGNGRWSSESYPSTLSMSQRALRARTATAAPTWAAVPPGQTVTGQVVLAWSAAITVVFAPLAVRRYRRTVN